MQRTLKVRKPVRVVRTIAASVDELELPTLCHLSLDLALNQRLGPGQGCHASVDVPGFRGRHHSYFTPSFFAPSDFVRYRAKGRSAQPPLTRRLAAVIADDDTFLRSKGRFGAN